MTGVVLYAPLQPSQMRCAAGWRQQLAAARPCSRCGRAASFSWALNHLLLLTISLPLPGPMVRWERTVFSPSREHGTARGSTAPVPGLLSGRRGLPRRAAAAGWACIASAHCASDMPNDTLESNGAAAGTARRGGRFDQNQICVLGPQLQLSPIRLRAGRFRGLNLSEMRRGSGCTVL